MKIKKLLTLLAISSMIVACGAKTNKGSSSSDQPAPDSSVSAPASSDDGSSDSAPAPSASGNPDSSAPDASSSAPAPSSDSSAPAPSSSSSAPAPSSSSSAPAPSSSSSAPAPSSSSSAPAPSSSSSEPAPSSSSSSSSSSSQAATLSSIEVTTPPTKVEYTTDDTALDPSGIVVTGTYSDGSTKVIEAGYTFSEVDFSAVGPQTVTVTYEGLTATFEITISQAKPTDWTADEKALFESACYGFVPTFFYGPDYGLGELKWTLANNGTLYAEGGNLEAPAEGADFAFKPVAESLVNDGFVISSEPDPAASSPTYHYTLLKQVTYQESTRYIRARLSAADAKGNFAAAGEFYMDFSDPYYYSWDATGWGAILKSAFKTDIDFPTLPDGLYEKTFTNYVSMYVSYMGYCPITVDGLGVGFDPAPILANFENENWEVAPASLAEDEFDYVSASKDGKLRIEISFDRAHGTADFTFTRQDAIDDMVKVVADQMGLKAFAFDAGETSSSYYFVIELGEGETLPQARDRYAELLVGDGVARKFTRVNYSDEEDDVKANYVYEAPEESEDDNIRVTLYADKLTSGTPYLGVVVREYTPFSQDLLNYCTVFGLDPFNLSVDSDSGDYFIDINITEELTQDEMIARYANMLIADAALDNPVVGASQVGDVVASVNDEGIGYKYVTYANDTTLVLIYAAVKKAADGSISRLVELIFQDYNPAPESAWVDALSATLGVTLAWQNDNGCFYSGGQINLGENTYQQVSSYYANMLMNADENLELLSIQSASTYYVITLYGEDGYIEIQCFKSSNGYDYLSFFVYLFEHPEYDPFVNAIIAATGVSLVYVEEGDFYYGLNENVNAGLSLQQYGKTIATGYSIGKQLVAATGLQFSFDTTQSGLNADPEDYYYLATFTNPDGYVVEMYLLGNENGMFTGYIQVYVYAPSEDAGE